MTTKIKDGINFDDLFIETPEELSLTTIDHGIEKKDLNEEQLQDELSYVVEEYAHSNEKVKELIEIYRKLIQKTDENISWLANSNTFKRIWRRVTGKTFRIDVQNTQYLNDLNKVGLELFNQLNKKMLIQQQQLVWLQKEINFVVNEQDKFRQKLKAQLEKIIESAHARFERVERLLRDTTKSLLELKNDLVKLGVRVDVIEREQAKIKHRINTIEWSDSIQNKRDGEPDYFKNFEKHSFKKVTSFLNLIDDFLVNTEFSPTLIDYKYLADVLGFYGFDKNNYLYGKTIIELLVKQSSDSDLNSIEYVIKNWRKRFGIVDDVIPRDLFNRPISQEKPFSSFTERVIYLIHQEISQGKSVTYSSVEKALLNYELGIEDREKVIDNFIRVAFESVTSFDELKFDWYDIAKEYISFRKNAVSTGQIEVDQDAVNNMANKVLRNPSKLLNEVNTQYGKLRSDKEVSSQILGWKNEFDPFFTLTNFHSNKKIELTASCKRFQVSIKVVLEEKINKSGDIKHEAKMLYIIPIGEKKNFDFQEATDFMSAFGGLNLIGDNLGGDYWQYEFLWRDPNEAFSNDKEFAVTVADKIIQFLTAETRYVEIVKNVSNKIDSLTPEFKAAKIEQVIEKDGCFKIEMKSEELSKLCFWQNHNGEIFETHGEIGNKYLEDADTRNKLGYPISDTIRLKAMDEEAGDNALFQLFENGEMKFLPGRIIGGEVKVRYN